MDGTHHFHHMPAPYGIPHQMQPPPGMEQYHHHPQQEPGHPQGVVPHAYDPSQQGHHQGAELDSGHGYQDGSLYSAVVEAGLDKGPPAEDVDDELLARVEVADFTDEQIRTRLKLLTAEAQKRQVQVESWLPGGPPELTEADQVKVEKARVAKAERRLGRIYEGLVKEVGGYSWIYGFVTASGQPKSGASESMRKWWLEQVRFNEVACPDRKLPFNPSRLPKTANLTDCEGKSPQQLMIKLTHRQLASMASEWLRLCEPSAAQYPLNGSQGSPPWWPDTIQYKKPDLLKNQALTEVLELGLKNFLPNYFATDAMDMLLKILIRSKVLRKAGAPEMAIVVKVINTAVALWAKPDPSRRASTPGSSSGRRNRQKSGTSYTGLMGGASSHHQESGFKRKRRKREEIGERPFKCELCDHPGYTSRGGLSDHKCSGVSARMEHLPDSGLVGGQGLEHQILDHPAMGYPGMAHHEDPGMAQMH